MQRRGPWRIVQQRALDVVALLLSLCLSVLSLVRLVVLLSSESDASGL